MTVARIVSAGSPGLKMVPSKRTSMNRLLVTFPLMVLVIAKLLPASCTVTWSQMRFLTIPRPSLKIELEAITIVQFCTKTVSWVLPRVSMKRPLLGFDNNMEFRMMVLVTYSFCSSAFMRTNDWAS